MTFELFWRKIIRNDAYVRWSLTGNRKHKNMSNFWPKNGRSRLRNVSDRLRESFWNSIWLRNKTLTRGGLSARSGRYEREFTACIQSQLSKFKVRISLHYSYDIDPPRYSLVVKNKYSMRSSIFWRLRKAPVANWHEKIKEALSLFSTTSTMTFYTCYNKGHLRLALTYCNKKSPCYSVCHWVLEIKFRVIFPKESFGWIAGFHT